MKTDKSPSKRSKIWIALGISVLLGIGIFVWLPHKTTTIESQSTLQGGKKMAVRVTLQSPWGWATPSRIVGMDVLIDGSSAPVVREAYYGLQPLDSSKQPLIVERAGYPEIIMKGQPGSRLNEVRWRFLNYSYSERHILKDHKSEVVYHAEPPPAPTVLSAPSKSPTDLVIALDKAPKTITPERTNR